MLIWTTLPPEIVSTATIMALYRVRWPIERVFKRLKSILNMDHLRARKDSPLAEVYLHGKLLYAWIVEKRLCRRCGHDWHRLDQPRRATPWRIWTLLQRELTTAIHGARHWNVKRWPEPSSSSRSVAAAGPCKPYRNGLLNSSPNAKHRDAAISES
ncbi:MAG: transposase [Candidatus Competibacteraceae bacterium]|nr:transposase [Candidatus Competibacteraceae bacterium]